MTVRAFVLTALIAAAVGTVFAQTSPNEELVSVDSASTGTLSLALSDASRATEEIRALAARERYDANPEPASDRMKVAFNRAAAIGAKLRPDSRPRLIELRNKTERLLQYFESDYSDANRRAAGQTARLLSECVTALETETAPALGAEADSTQGNLPPAWTPAEFANPQYRASLRAKAARELVTEIVRQRATVADSSHEEDIRAACIRAAEAARELSTRADSLADSSRRPFRNAALRADVVAENIARFSTDRDRPWRERQLRLLGEIAGELGAFLNVNGK